MPKVQLNIRVEKKILEALKERAERENRTVSNLVETLIQKSLTSPP
jgi:hypothetical protein